MFFVLLLEAFELARNDKKAKNKIIFWTIVNSWLFEGSQTTYLNDEIFYFKIRAKSSYVLRSKSQMDT